MDWLHKKAFWMSLASIVDIILKGVPPLNLESSIKDGIKYIKAYGGLLQGGVPSGYTAVEYIEGDGASYIDTGTYSSNLTRTEVVVKASTTSSALPVFGDYQADGSDIGKSNALYYVNGTPGFYVTDKGGTIPGTSETNKTKLGNYDTSNFHNIVVDLKNRKGIFDGTETALVNTTIWTSQRTQVLFARRATNGVVGLYSACRLKSCKIYEDDVLVRDFIPAKRNSDSAIGMFDAVSNTFFTNAGTGTFTAGNEIAPTPSTPIDLVCNNGALKILDKSDWTIFTNPTSVAGQGVFISADGKWYNANDRGAGVAIPLTIGKQYTLVIHKKTATLGTILRYGQSPQETPTGAGIQLTDWYRGNITDGQMISFVAKQPYLVMQLSADAAEAGMIQEAIEVLEAQGDNETLAITTKNLCNVAADTDGYYIGADGTIGTNANSCYSALIPVVAGQTYTWSGICGDSGRSNNKRVHAYIDGVWNQQVSLTDAPANQPFEIVFTVPDGCNGIRISRWNTDTQTQVEVGSTKTSYIEYNGSTAGVANLLKIDNYVDTQEILTGTIAHNCGILVLDGTERYLGNSTVPAEKTALDNCYTLAVPLGPSDAITSRRVMCTHFGSSDTLPSADDRQGLALLGKTQNHGDASLSYKYMVGFGAMTAYPTIADFKAFLAAQYAAGTPVIVVYPLATAQDEVSPVPQTMQTTAGDNTLDIVQAGMSGLEVEVQYTKEG